MTYISRYSNKNHLKQGLFSHSYLREVRFRSWLPKATKSVSYNQHWRPVLIFPKTRCLALRNLFCSWKPVCLIVVFIHFKNYFFFFLNGIGVWTPGSMYAKQTFYTSPVLKSHFLKEVENCIILFFPPYLQHQSFWASCDKDAFPTW
jgi:hypothetical protein